MRGRTVAPGLTEVVQMPRFVHEELQRIMDSVKDGIPPGSIVVYSTETVRNPFYPLATKEGA